MNPPHVPHDATPVPNGHHTTEARALFAREGGRVLRLVDLGLDEDDQTLLLRVADGDRALMLALPLSGMKVIGEDRRLVETRRHSVSAISPQLVLCGLDPQDGVRYVRRAAVPVEWLALYDDGMGSDLIACPHNHSEAG